MLVVGGASWNTIIRVNRFPDPGPTTVRPVWWHEAIGSSGAGKALNLVRLGADVTLIAALGDDEDGERVAAAISSAGISLIRLSEPDGTARHVNVMDSGGRRMSYLLQGRNVPNLEMDTIERAVTAADLVYLAVVDFSQSLVPVVQSHNRPVWTDLHAYDGTSSTRNDLIEVADVVLFSGERLGDPRPTMERLCRRGKRLVVCTLAERGALALTASGEWLDVAAEKADVVDTNGAGDAFAAGLMVADFLGLTLGDALAVAARSAAMSIGSDQLASPQLSLDRVLMGRGESD